MITPEFNSTAIHADLWVPVKAGYDGHLALSIIQRIIARKLYKPQFLKEYTDLPLLVRADTKELVRLSDLDPKSKELDTHLVQLFAKHDHECFLTSRFRRNKGQYQKAFLEKAKFIAYGDVRMNDFGLYADVLLPCKTPYESWDLRTNPGYHRYANIAYPPPGLKPVGESKSEWEIATLLVEKARHKATGDAKQIHIVDKTHTQEGVRRLDELVKEFTKDGTLRTDKHAVEYALEHVEQFKPNNTKTSSQRASWQI